MHQKIIEACKKKNYTYFLLPLSHSLSFLTLRRTKREGKHTNFCERAACYPQGVLEKIMYTPTQRKKQREKK